MEEKFICPCGLNCSDCLFYKPEIYEAAKKLKKVIIDSELDVFFGKISENKSWKTIAEHLNEDCAQFEVYFDSFQQFPDFMNVLDDLIKLQCVALCMKTGGCSMGGVTHQCDAVKCVTSKGLVGCWDCAESDVCEKLSFVKKAYGKVIDENFRTIRTKGVGAVKSRGNKYYVWQQDG
jgi:hypothetical protein